MVRDLGNAAKGGGGGGVIESITRFEITIASGATSGTATIASVDTAEAVAISHGDSNPRTASQASSQACRVTLTNSTTVTASRQGSSGTITCYGEVIEYVSGSINSIQEGSDNISGGGGFTITAVDTTKSHLMRQGVTTSETTATKVWADWNHRAKLASSTSVSYEVTDGSGGPIRPYYAVVEFN